MRITFVDVERTQIEVPCKRHGFITYRWAPAYYVYKLDGTKVYPPVRRMQMYADIREIGGPNARPRYIERK